MLLAFDFRTATVPFQYGQLACEGSVIPHSRLRLERR
jgi:hypothetical protein